MARETERNHKNVDAGRLGSGQLLHVYAGEILKFTFCNRKDLKPPQTHGIILSLVIRYCNASMPYLCMTLSVTGSWFGTSEFFVNNFRRNWDREFMSTIVIVMSFQIDWYAVWPPYVKPCPERIDLTLTLGSTLVLDLRTKLISFGVAWREYYYISWTFVSWLLWAELCAKKQNQTFGWYLGIHDLNSAVDVTL